jgi:hypothetical protein
VSTGYDYTKTDATDIDDFYIPDVATIDKSASEIEAERSFRDAPPGEYELVVLGFLDKPKPETKTVYVNGQRASFNAHSVIVKFGLATDPGAQVTDYFLLPPDNPAELPAYFHGASNPEGKGAGFNASKFYQFIERLGFAYPKGGNLPAEARRLGNWKGRRVVAMVVAGDPQPKKGTGQTDPVTGQWIPEKIIQRSEIKLFSYKPAGTPTQGSLPGMAPPPPIAGRPAPAMQPRPQAPRPQAAAPAGLDNI